SFFHWNYERASHCQNNASDYRPRQPTKGYFDEHAKATLIVVQCASPYYHESLSITPTNDAPTNTLPKSRLEAPHATPSTNRKLSTNHKPILHLIHQFRTTLQNRDHTTMAVQSFSANATIFHPSQPRESCRVRKATTRFLDGKNACYLPRLASALGVGLTYNKDAAGAEADDDSVPMFDCTANSNGNQAPNYVMASQEASVFSALKPRRSERARQASKRFLEADIGARMPRLSAALGVATSDGPKV
ncbi:hypothetical protein BDR22DRAFT_718562, partial [Usnea florida]